METLGFERPQLTMECIKGIFEPAGNQEKQMAQSLSISSFGVQKKCYFYLSPKKKGLGLLAMRETLQIISKLYIGKDIIEMDTKAGV